MTDNLNCPVIHDLARFMSAGGYTHRPKKCPLCGVLLK